MHLDRRVCHRARRSRDARFDGRFFIAVTTTKIYCRPVCPARAPKDRNVRYFPTAAAAEAAGYRPCLRCRPEAAPGTPAWSGTSAVVSRALRLIDEGALNGAGVARLADRLGVTDRHLRRLFLQHLGATPLQVALTRRAQAAKTLLDQTSLSCAEVAAAAGFGSLRRFNAHIRRTYHRNPTELRRLVRQQTGSEAGHYSFRLSFRPPYDWLALMAFLGARATPGVERVDEAGYRRTIAIDGVSGTVSVRRPDAAATLALEVRFPDARRLLGIVDRVRAMFDLGADPALIAEPLAVDRLLAGPLLAHPGIRVPGAWDGFELAVRAIIGQQIAVSAATTMAGRIARLFGTPVRGSDLDRLFPTAAQLADAALEQAGLIRTRADAIRTLSRRVVEGRITFDRSRVERDTIAALLECPGIGPWTAEYIAMRAFGRPDAFPAGDLVLRRMTGAPTPHALERQSESWRPWRAYAVMLLWQAAADARSVIAAIRRRPERNAHAPTRRLRTGGTLGIAAAAGAERPERSGAGRGNPVVAKPSWPTSSGTQR
jgi:AraC family transcriptional regulator of adaptative response / DNA-3-methyladenine glycosylase II